MALADIEDALNLLSGRLGWGSVAVVGAGLSLPARYPTMRLLEPLVWQAVDADPEQRTYLARALGRDLHLPGKILLGGDPTALSKAWKIISTSPVARQAFQQGFADLDRERSSAYSPAFDAVGRLLHARIFEHVVSLNWDTGPEAAYRRRYGNNLPAGWLSKPHGDAARPDLDWVLPSKAGRLDLGLLDRVAAFREGHPRTLVVIGYSESDEVIVDQLIAPLSSAWEVIRIGPSARGQFAIVQGAEKILPPLADMLCSADVESPWEYLGFDEQRNGLAAALRGARLGPGDVGTCPRLPEVEEVVSALHAADAVALRGASGGGKSITAYQALHDLNEDGFEIVRASEGISERSVHETVQYLIGAPLPTVALIDDAQAKESDLLRRLAESATPERKILIVSTDDVPGPAIEVPIAEQRAVKLIAAELLSRRAEALGLLRELDDRIGEGYLDEPLEWRLELASREELPWQFIFTLVGGWRRIRTILARLRDNERADLALLAVSVLQLASADAGARPGELQRAAILLGREEQWMEAALNLLRTRRLVTGDTHMRTPHVRMADVVLKVLLHPPEWPSLPSDSILVPPIMSTGDKNEARQDTGHRHHPATANDHPHPVEEENADRSAVAALLAHVLDDPGTSLRGILWLLDCFRGPEIRWVLSRSGLPGRERLLTMARRALSMTDASGRQIAGFLLAELIHWDDGAIIEELENAESNLARWVVEVEPSSAWGLARLFNDLAQKRPDLTERILAQTDPTAIARQVSQTSWTDAAAWAELIDRLAYAGGQQFAEQLASALDAGALESLFSRLPDESLYAVEELAKAIYFLRGDLGTNLIETAAAQLARRLSNRPAEATAALHEIFWWPLGMSPNFLRRRRPSPAQRRVARKLARGVDGDRIASAINGGTRRDWYLIAELLVFIAEADRATFDAIVKAVDANALDDVTEGLWQSVPRELEQLLALLSTPDGGPARELLIRHADDIGRLSNRITLIAPEVALSAMKRGVPLDLELVHHDWLLAAGALNSLHQIDPDVAMLLLEANRAALSKGLALQGSDAVENLSVFLTVVDTIAPQYLDGLLANLEPDVIAGWRTWLRKRDRSRRQVAELTHRTSHGMGAAAAAARELLDRYPSLRETLGDV